MKISYTKYLCVFFAWIVQSWDYIFSRVYLFTLFEYQKGVCYLNGINPDGLVFIGHTILKFEYGSKVKVEDNFRCFSGTRFGITTNRCSKLWVGSNGVLNIGKNVGITNTSIICTDGITIGDNTIIGAGSMIMDSNFHSIYWEERRVALGVSTAVHKPIVIENDVFIGTNCIICKGVTIGSHSVVAAGSVVVKDIPANEMWGGNPAKIIKKI